MVAVPPTGTEIRPWTGAYLLIAFAALVLAAPPGRRARRRAARPQLRLAAAHQRGRRSAGRGDRARLGRLVDLGRGGWPDRPAATGCVAPYLQNAMLSDAGVRVLALIEHERQARRPSCPARRGALLGRRRRPAPARRRGPRVRVRWLDGRPRPGRRPGPAAGGRHGRLRHLSAAARSRHRLRVGDRGDHRGDRPDRQHARPWAPRAAAETTTVWQLQPAVTRVTVAEGEQSTAVDDAATGGPRRRLGSPAPARRGGRPALAGQRRRCRPDAARRPAGSRPSGCRPRAARCRSTSPRRPCGC